MRKLLCLSAVAAFAMAFAFVSVADADPGGNGKGRKKTNAIAGSIGELVVCSAAGVPTGSIDVGDTESQCFTYTLSLTGMADGTVAHEVISSNFDLSGDAEDEDNDGFTTALEELDDATDRGGTANDGQCEDPANPTDFVACNTITEVAAAASGLCDDGLCDGIEQDDVCAVGICDGIAVTGVTGDNASCTVNLARRDSAVKLNSGAIPPKQEEILNIEVASDTGTVACDVQVWVETVGNPGSVAFDFNDVKIPDCTDGLGGAVADCTFDTDGNLEADQNVVFLLFEPTTCTPLRRHTRFDADGDGVSDTTDPLAGIITGTDGLPIVEFVEVNRGAMFFDVDGLLELDNDDFAAIVGGSIQLEPMGCDTDGDLILDVDELANCALDPDTSCTAS